MSRGGLDVLLLADEMLDPEGTRYSALHDTLEAVGAIRSLGRVGPKQRARLSRRLPGAELFDDSGLPVFPHRPSLGIAAIATALGGAGYSCAIIDNYMRYRFRQEQIIDIFDDTPPAVIGISTTFMMSPAAIEAVVSGMRELCPTARIVLGGPTARRLARLHGCADYCVIGEGEQPMLGIMECVLRGRDPMTVPHIAFRTADGGVAYSPSACESGLVGIIGKPFRSRADAPIPITDWSLYGRSRDIWYSLEASRGCKYNCYYCSYDRGKVVRDLDDLRAELTTNARLGITRYRIGDSNFTDGPARNPRYPHDVCQLMIDLDLGLEWSCYSRVDDLSDELAALMRRAGCIALTFGIESGDDRLLRLMRKGHTAADAREGIRVAQRNGIHACANFVCGYPGETEETFANTLAFVEEVRPDSIGMSEFFLETHVPVRGPNMSEFAIEGYGTSWRHATMDSTTAKALAGQGLRYLHARGLSLGAEYSFALYMSLGLSVGEVKELFQIANDRIDGTERMIELYCAKIAPAIAADQEQMCCD